jgi:hypothetical protein
MVIRDVCPQCQSPKYKKNSQILLANPKAIHFSFVEVFFLP